MIVSFKLVKNRTKIDITFIEGNAFVFFVGNNLTVKRFKEEKL
jgi:hypothetical protein